MGYFFWEVMLKELFYVFIGNRIVFNLIRRFLIWRIKAVLLYFITRIFFFGGRLLVF